MPVFNPADGTDSTKLDDAYHINLLRISKLRVILDAEIRNMPSTAVEIALERNEDSSQG